MHPEEDEKLKETHPVSPAGDLVAGRFEILRLVGSGGMGRVFQARDTQMDRSVALKFLHSHKLQDRHAVQRLLREAKALSELHHSNVCDIYQIAVLPDGGVYIVSEFIDGISLRQVLSQEGPLSEARLTAIFDQVLQAVQAAHDQGIVHRDLTPANILLTAAGEVKLIDFGIAKLLGDGEEQKLTATGVVIGTVSYMSPEQLQGGAVDARADLFSVACAMYEAAAGYLPWDSADDLAALQKRLTAQPKPLPGKLSERLQSVILQNLAADRDSRCASATQMRDVLLGLAPYAVPAKSQKMRKRMVAAVVAVGLTSLLVATSVYAYVNWYLPQQQSIKQVDDAEQTFDALISLAKIHLAGRKADEAFDTAQQALLALDHEKRFQPTIQQTGEALAVTYAALLAKGVPGDGVKPDIMKKLETFVAEHGDALEPYYHGSLMAGLGYGYERAGAKLQKSDKPSDQALRASMYAKSEKAFSQAFDLLLRDKIQARSRSVIQDANRVVSRLNLGPKERISFYADLLAKAGKVAWVQQFARTHIVEAKRRLYQQEPDPAARFEMIKQTLQFGSEGSCNDLANVYEDYAVQEASRGNWVAAKKRYKEAEKRSRDQLAHDPQAEKKMEHLGEILVGLGRSERELHHPERSIPYYVEGIAILKKHPGHDNTLTAGLFELASSYFELNRFSEARAYYQEAVVGCSGKPELRERLGASYAASGTTCRLLKDYAGAYRNFQKATDVFASLRGTNDRSVKDLEPVLSAMKTLVEKSASR